MNKSHIELKRALRPLALEVVRRGEFPELPVTEHIANIIAHYAATDMVLVGRTLLLPMDEVEKLLVNEPDMAPCDPHTTISPHKPH